MSVIGFLTGWNEYRIDGAYGERLLNMFMRYKIIYRDFKVIEDGRISFTCSPITAASVLSLCRKYDIKIEKTRSGGVPYVFWKYRKRWGLLLGAVIAALMMGISNDYIWDIRLIGNESVTYTEVIEALSKYGISVGSRIDEIDVDKTETLVLLNSEKISWIAVNIEGTLANVQIREATDPPHEETARPANIVAASDGVIDHLEIYSGTAVVKAGDTVRKGDLLISGVRDSAVDGLSVTRAFGRVFAETEHVFTVEIPFEYEKKSVASSKKIEKNIIFFGKEIKVFKNGRNNAANCDTINRVEYLKFFGDVRIPIGIRTVTEITYNTVRARYELSEAAELANYKLSKELETHLPDAQILQKSIYSQVTSESYIIECKVRCIENIGRIYEFDFNEIDTDARYIVQEG